MKTKMMKNAGKYEGKIALCRKQIVADFNKRHSFQNRRAFAFGRSLQTLVQL
jgi:hypothetical protein